jgi:hypothetical protein
MYRQEQCEKDPQLKLCVILLSIVTTGQSQFQKRGCRHQSGMWVSLSEAPGTSEGGNSINKSTADQLYININLAEFMWWQ